MNDLQYNLTKLKGKIITIDGPAGAGKSTTARILAARLGYQYLDTGAMYRALTYYSRKLNIEPADEEKLKRLAENLDIEFKTNEGLNQVFINGEDVTTAIRTPEVTRNASEVSAHPGVRRAMVAKQQQLGRRGSIVAEGRDTTTVVFPKADVKFYMDATIEQRAQRRVLDLAKMGIDSSVEEQITEIERRDGLDSGREHSPLRLAEDAHRIDTSAMTIEEQTDHMLHLIISILSAL